jgi:hypothetical protein
MLMTWTESWPEEKEGTFAAVADSDRYSADAIGSRPTVWVDVSLPLTEASASVSTDQQKPQEGSCRGVGWGICRCKIYFVDHGEHSNRGLPIPPATGANAATEELLAGAERLAPTIRRRRLRYDRSPA